MGECDAAIEVFGTAGSLTHAHGLTAEEALSLANRAGVLLRLNRPEEAIITCERSIELFRELPATRSAPVSGHGRDLLGVGAVLVVAPPAFGGQEDDQDDGPDQGNEADQ